MEPLQLIGQLFGGIAVLLGFLSFQVSSSKKLLLVQIATAAVFCIHYLLIGATSACILNIVGIIRNIIYYHRDKKFFSGNYIPYLFGLIMLISGIFSWQGIFSLFLVSGQVINTVCLSLKNPQNIRKSILVSSPLVLIYDVYALSIGGIIYESVVIISSIIGLRRYRNSDTM
jgi:hypothetical protein